MQLGGFDLRFGPGSRLGATGQETQMMRQMKSAGLQFRFLPEAIVWHQVNPHQYSARFLVQRKLRNGVAIGLQERLMSNGGSTACLKPTGTLVYYIFRAVLGVTLLPILVVVGSRQRLTKARCWVASGRGILRGWFCRAQ